MNDDELSEFVYNEEQKRLKRNQDKELYDLVSKDDDKKELNYTPVENPIQSTFDNIPQVEQWIKNNKNIPPPNPGDDGYMKYALETLKGLGYGAARAATFDQTPWFASRVLPQSKNTNDIMQRKIRDDMEESKQDSPYANFAGELGGIAAISPFLGPLGAAANPVYGAIAGAQGEHPIIGAIVGGGLGKMGDVAMKQAMPLIQKGVGYGAQALGKLGQLPTMIKEGIGEPFAKVGKQTFLSDFIKGEANETINPTDSRKVEALKKIFSNSNELAEGSKKAAEMTGEKSATNAMEEILPAQTLDMKFHQLTEPEKQVVYQAIKRGFDARGISVPIDVVKVVVDANPRGNVLDTIRMANAIDAERAAKYVATQYKVLGQAAYGAGEEFSPNYSKMVKNAEGLIGEMSSGKVSNNAVINGRRGSRGMLLDDPRLEEPMLNPGVYEDKTFAATPGAKAKQAAAEAEAQKAEDIRKKAPWLTDDDISDTKKYTGVEPQTMDDMHKAGAVAANRLRNIEWGDKAMSAASTLGGAVSFGTHHNIPGTALMSAAFGTRGLNYIGKKVEDYGSNILKPDVFANSFVKNPSFVWKMAQQPGVVGDAGRQLMNSMKESGIEGVKRKLFVLMGVGEFRDFLTKQLTGNENSSMNNKISLNDMDNVVELK